MQAGGAWYITGLTTTPHHCNYQPCIQTTKPMSLISQLDSLPPDNSTNHMAVSDDLDSERSADVTSGTISQSWATE